MRHEPIYVYRRRRLAVGVALAVLVLLVWRVIGGNGNDGADVEAGAATTTTVASTTTTLPAPPPCAFGDEEITEDPTAAWASVIVDTARRLPADYEPADLQDASAAGFPTGFRVRAIMLPDLDALRAAANANGTPIGLIAAYRTYQQQADLFARREAQLGPEVAKQRAARAGHSEHQLGTGIDVGSEGDIDVTQEWGTSDTGRWIAAHAHEFGFVVSYPEGGLAATCYDYEPWHLRYVGREKAAAVHASGLSLREHLWAESQGVTPGPAGG